MIAVELFVAVLGASNYTYAEATRTQQVPDWIASHQRAFAVLRRRHRGRRAATSSRAASSSPCRYEPGLQRTYEEFAQHYGTVILPARPGEARDKAKVEVAVQVVERWILARLRHETFFSLAALNARIAELLADLNARPMRLYRASRRELFERLDQPALRPLPAEPFVYGEWKTAPRQRRLPRRAPRPLLLRPLRARARARRRAPDRDAPSRSSTAASASPPIGAASSAAATPPTPPTCPRPISATWSGRPRASSTGRTRSARRPPPSSQAILADRPHPEQGYRSCLGILRLAKRYGPERLEAACARAGAVGARSYRHVDSILKHGLDRLALPAAAPPLTLTPVHEHVRGPDYYQ